MIKCIYARHLFDAATAKTPSPVSRGENVLVIVNVFCAAMLGYISIYACEHLAWPAGGGPVLDASLWKVTAFVGLVGSLAGRKTDADASTNTSSIGIRAMMFSALMRTGGVIVLLLVVGMITGAIDDVPGSWLFIWAMAFPGWMCISRLLLRSFRRRAVRLERCNATIAFIGDGAALARLTAQFKNAVYIARIIDHSALADSAIAEALADVVDLARRGTVGLVVVASSDNGPSDAFKHILDCLKAAPVRVAFYAMQSAMIFGDPALVAVGGVNMRLIADRPLSHRDMRIKMLVDRCGALALIVLALPLLIAITGTILVETGRPVFFKQRRNGWCGRLFTVYKFRTMRHVAGQQSSSQTVRGDPRCTRVGAFLRRNSLDELPQLWNILRGDMSLVGPRPHADFLHAGEREASGTSVDYVQRQRVKPGLTGWAQVHGLRGAADTPEKLRRRVEYDRYYIDNWSIWLDIRILAQTPRAVFLRENAF